MRQRRRKNPKVNKNLVDWIVRTFGVRVSLQFSHDYTPEQVAALMKEKRAKIEQMDETAMASMVLEELSDYEFHKA